MATIYTAAIQELYVAYFNRPADAGGLAYWESVVAANNGDTAAVSAAFAASAEYKAEYDQLTLSGVVSQIYQNLFNRAPEAEGLAYWVAGIQAGNFTIDQAVTVIANGAQGTDLVAFDSKVLVATAFTAALDTDAEKAGYSGDLANAAAKKLLAGITTAAQATAAVVPATLDASIAAVVKAGVPFSLTTALADLDAAQQARADFLAEADGDDNAKTSATEGELTTAVTTAEGDIAAEFAPGVYAGSAGVKAALLADEVALRAKTLVDAQTAFTTATANTAKVAGLSAAIVNLSAATATQKTAAAAADKAEETMAGAVASYNFTSATDVTVELDGTATILVGAVATPAIVLVDGKLVFDAALTAEQKTALTPVLNASIAVEAAQKAELSADTAVLAAQLTVDRTDYIAADAGDELATVAAAMKVVKLAAGALPTAAQITTELNALTAIEAAAQKVVDDVNAAGGTPTQAQNDALTAAEANLTTFTNAVAAFDGADNANPLTDAQTGAETAVDTAADNVEELAGLIADFEAAKAVVAELGGFDDAITEAGDVFEDNGFTQPITVAGVLGASTDSDIYIAGDVDGTIVAFGTSGEDMLYIGTEYTLNTGKLDTGNNSALEVFVSANATGDAVITLETVPFGSNSSDAEVVITLTGVAVADVNFANGIITVG